MASSKYWRLKTIQKEEKTKRWKIIFLWVSAGAIFLTVLWLFFMSPVFKITKIRLPENDIVTDNDIRNLMSGSAPLNLGENIFILSKDKIKAGLIAAFPAITDINITKEPLHSLVVDFEKRIQLGIWCNETVCYYFNKEGIIFKDAPQTEGSLILKVKDLGKKDVSLGNKVLNDGLLNFLIEFNKKVIENDKVKIIEFNIESGSFDLKAVTDAGWVIYLDRNQDPKLEANNLFTTLNEAVKNGEKNLSYIDLRIPNRVYYCKIGQTCAGLRK